MLHLREYFLMCSAPVAAYFLVCRWANLTGELHGVLFYKWGTASRGATYHFRVFSYSHNAQSEPSATIIFATKGER